MVRLSDRTAPNRRTRRKTQMQPLDLQQFLPDGACRQQVHAAIIFKLPDVPSQPNRISEMAESPTKDILDALEAEVPPPPHRTH